MEIVKNNENKLLGRNEVTAKLTVEKATLSRADAKSKLAKALKVEEDLIIVKKIKSIFGSLDVVIEANIYDSKESLEKNARPHLVKRNAPAAVEAEEEAN